ncbi:DUF349 domain-containing protein [Halocola ammonii]
MKSEIIEKLKSILENESPEKASAQVDQLAKEFENAEGDDSLNETFSALLKQYREKTDGEIVGVKQENNTETAMVEEHEHNSSENEQDKELLSESDVSDGKEVEEPKQEVKAPAKAEAPKAVKTEDEPDNKNAADPIVDEHDQIESEKDEEPQLVSESDVSDEEKKPAQHSEATEEKKETEAKKEPTERPDPKDKEELISQLREMLATEEAPAIRKEMREIKRTFKDFTKAEIAEQKKAWEAEEHDEEDEFFPQVNPLDQEFEQLLDQVNDKIKEHDQRVKAERERNLQEKKKVLSELEALVKEEENIGKLFSVFNELQDKWNEIGHIPGDQYRDVQDAFHKLKDEFYYNVDIYKQLKEHDLHINEKRKQDLIDQVKKVKDLKSIKERERLVKTYQRQWMDLGPSPRETYKEMADEFFGTCREIFEEIQKHYDKLHEEHEENLVKKQALVKKMEELLSLEIKNHGTWKKKTDEVIGLQKEWKTIGFAPREHNETIWKEFRGLCDTFFDNKREFYDKRRAEQDVHKQKKEKLVSKAEEVKDSEDWKNTTKQLIDLQKQWKEVGAAAQRDEQQLWQRFRAACDTFFNRKKDFFSGMDERQEENLKKKNDLIAEIEKAELTGEKEKDIAMMKDFSQRFNEIGFVPKKNLQEVYDRYNKALDEKYDKLDLDKKEKTMLSYKQRVDSISESPDSDHLVRKEKRLLHDKIDRLKQRMIQYENNMEFLSGDGASSFRKEYERKIDKSRKEIDEIKQKLDLLP